MPPSLCLLQRLAEAGQVRPALLRPCKAALLPMKSRSRWTSPPLPVQPPKPRQLHRWKGGVEEARTLERVFLSLQEPVEHRLRLLLITGHRCGGRRGVKDRAELPAARRPGAARISSPRLSALSPSPSSVAHCSGGKSRTRVTGGSCQTRPGGGLRGLERLSARSFRPANRAKCGVHKF